MTGARCAALGFAPFFFLATISFCHSLQRTLDYAFNEDCNELCKNTNARLGHVRSTGPNDTLHYLWDFTENPTVFVAVTSPSAKLHVDWPKYLARIPNSLNFTEKPKYVFGVAIERLLEFNDIGDNARIDHVTNSNIVELKLTDFEWHYKNLTKHDSLVEFYIEATSYKNSESKETRHGTIKFLLHAFGNLNHSHVIPRMLHSENATQVDIVIDHLDTKKGFSQSRFALELLIVSENDPSSILDINTKRKLDDEFTPGTFEIIELSTPIVRHSSAYLQWRPVSYIDHERDISHSTGTVFYPVKNATVNDYFGKNNLLYMYYGENMFNVLVQRLNISFGQEEDGFYKETGYNTWTFILGYETPPDERFSNIVIMIISLGIGLPLLILMISGLYVCVRRKPKQTNGELIIR